MYKKYIAETIGTFALSFIVLLATACIVGKAPIAVPVIAGLTVLLFVYTIGPVSGCHMNPAVTLGLLSVKKISGVDAFRYIVSQFAGAVVAVVFAKVFLVSASVVSASFLPSVFLAELIGAFFFNIGIAAVVFKKVDDDMSGVVIGGSLLLGLLFSSLAGAAGILNPAVAFALNHVSLMYMLAPIVGAVMAYKVYTYLIDTK
jgi:glycerol uptake facilitator-like aquaporin